MKNINSIILSLITLGLGYYFGRKQGKQEANIDFMKSERVQRYLKNPKFYEA